MSSVAREHLPRVFLDNKHLTAGLGLVLLHNGYKQANHHAN